MKGKPVGLQGGQREETLANEHVETEENPELGETSAEKRPPRAQGTGVPSGGSHSLGGGQEGTRRP